MTEPLEVASSDRASAPASAWRDSAMGTPPAEDERRPRWGIAAEAPTHLPPDDELPTGRPRRPSSTGAAPVRPSSTDPGALPPPPTLPGAVFDPLAVPLPPELAPTIYGWVRRLALQADLPGADRLLRDALADLTGSLAVVPIYGGADGFFTLGPDDELPAELQPLAVVGKTRRALVMSHAAYVPIATANEMVAVVHLTRNAHQPGFGLVEQVAMAALARESASILHHLATLHLQRAAEARADQASLYRPEALDSHRRRGQEGVIAELSPAWVRAAYPVLIAATVLALLLGILIHVPTYSSGTGVVVFEGTPVTAPLMGTVETIEVATGQAVRRGDVLVTLHAANEQATAAQAKAELEAALAQYLFDPADESARKALATAQAAARRADAAVEERTVRASKDGVVSDIRIRVGAPLQLGDHILSIVEPGTEPEVWAFLPGSDRPRLRAGMKLQVALAGYTKARETATIYYVSPEVIGAQAARRILGAELGDAVKLDGSYVLVKAKLPGSTFHAGRHTYRYHHGLGAKTEVRVEQKRFLVTLLPELSKYLD